MGVIILGFHGLQACLSAYTGLLSYTSITKLRNYEERTKQAAQYSNTAARQLHKTRTTQASGALSIFFSFISAVVLVVAAPSLPWRSTAIINLLNIAALYFGYRHLSNFWKEKAKVPFVQDFNDAIRTSNQLVSLLRILTLSWGLSCSIYAWQPLKPQTF